MVCWPPPHRPASLIHRDIKFCAPLPHHPTAPPHPPFIYRDIKFSRPLLPGYDKDTPPPVEPGPHRYGANQGGAYQRNRNALLEPRASHVYFVVRDDARPTDVLYQTMDTTWQAYNCWGSLNTYVGPICHRPTAPTPHQPTNSPPYHLTTPPPHHPTTPPPHHHLTTPPHHRTAPTSS